MKAIQWALFGIFLLFSSAIFAIEGKSSDSDPFSATSEGSQKLGAQVLQNYSINFTTNENITEINVNEGDILGAIPNMQEAGILSPDITQADMNVAPVTYASTAILYLTPLVITQVYSNPNIKGMEFKTFLNLTDDYGNPIKKQITSFNFNRELYNKINWDSFDAPKLVTLAHMKFTDWYAAKISEEGVFPSPQ